MCDSCGNLLYMFTGVITDNANTLQLYNCGSVELSDNRIEGNGGYWEEAGDAGLLGE